MSLSTIFTTYFILLLFVSGSAATSATLPSRLPFSPKPKETIDPALEKWMREYAEVIPVSEMNSEQVLVWITDKDPVARALILLESRTSKSSARDKKLSEKSSNDSKSGSIELENARIQVLTEIPKIIKNELEKPLSGRSPLLADLYLEWLSMTQDQQLLEKFVDDIFNVEPSNSCASKSRTISKITRERVSLFSKDQLIEAIGVSNSYKSMTHRRRYLEALANALPEEKRADVLKEFRAVAQDLPLLLRRFPWLQEDDLTKASQSSIFVDIGRHVRQKKCHDGENAFSKILESEISPSTISYAVEAGTEIERCYRAERRASAVAFWHRISPKMEKRFGKPGRLWTVVRLGYLKWVMSELDDALALLEQVVKDAGTEEIFKPIVAKSTYMLGKIAEDQSDLDRASKQFSVYVERYQNEEDFEVAFNSLIVNFAAKKMWKEMIVPLERYMAQQSKVHIDKRPVGLTAFTLFWLGRAQLQTGHADLAKDIWRRLAGEYYSTFYGAMGHYLLEQTSGQIYALEPSRVLGFDFVELEKPLSDGNKSVARRTLAFLKAGFPEKGRCEVEELTAVSDVDYDTQLVRTLLLHASGAWLDAIKIFDVMPRSVRNGLPIGFERVLFPRKYAELVKSRAAKLDLDPDFVFALMRQESVFATEATSPVGAMGLMQLMPSTARLEAGKLSSDYVDHNARIAILNALTKESSLREPEINVTLGVHHLWRLLKTYKSPVFALTAYNASPAATVKWQKTIASEDLLTFIERIPYKETRSYVKLILRNYFYYKRWYNIPDGKSQIHIDTVVEDLVKLAKATQEKSPNTLK